MNNEEMKNCGCGCNEDSKENCGCHDHEHNHEGCGCGCGEEHEVESLIVDLEDEEGNVVPCEVIDGFEYKDSEYVLVQNPGDGSIYLFKAVGEEGELVIPEDEEFEEVSKYYESLIEE